MAPPRSALAHTLPPLRTHQPYTAPFLARLSTFILYAPVSTVKYALSPSDIAGDASFTHLCKSLDPNSATLRPDTSVNLLCQRLLRMLNEIPHKLPRDEHPSPGTIPLAPCLLACYRVALHSAVFDCDVVMSETPDCEVPCPVFTSVSAPIPGALSDVTLITICVYIAYKYLAHDHFCVSLRHWAQPLETDAEMLVAAEKMFLGAIDYKIWVRQEAYLENKGRLDALWEAVFKNVIRLPPPVWLVKNLGKSG